MRLTVVGCAGSYPSAESAASCYLLEHDDHRVVLDLGSGAFGSLQRHTDPYALDAVLLSHLHVDHCIDLCAYYVARRYHPRLAPRPPVPVLGPVGTSGRLAAAYGMAELPGMHGEFAFRDHVEEREVGPFRITTTSVVHPVPAYAIRVEAGGRSVVYSGDTGACDALVKLARGSDLALFEGSFLSGDDNPPGLHLSAREAAEHANRAGVGRLVLTHLVAWNDRDASRGEAAAVYTGELTLAQAGATYEV